MIRCIIRWAQYLEYKYIYLGQIGLCVNLKHMSHKDQAVNFARSVAKTIKSAWVIMINGHVFNSCIITKVR